MKAIFDLIFKKEPLLSTAVITAVVSWLVGQGLLPPEFQGEEVVQAIIVILGVFVARQGVYSPATHERDLKSSGGSE